MKPGKTGAFRLDVDNDAQVERALGLRERK